MSGVTMCRYALLGCLVFWAVVGLFTRECFAQSVVVPSEFMGVNYGADPTAVAYPTYAGRGRVWDAAKGGVVHACQWAIMNPSNGSYSFANCDSVLTVLAAKNQPTVWTGGQVPSWVNGTQNLSTSGQRTNYYTFVQAMLAHVAGNAQCFGFFEQWNEAQSGTTWWAGADADMVTLMSTVYPLVKAACPQATVLSQSVTVAGDSSGTWTFPESSYYHWQQQLLSCLTGCFDALNIHTYEAFFDPGSNNSITFAPELTINFLNQTKTIANAVGLGSLPLYADEGWAGPTDASTTLSTTTAWAQAQAVMALLLASGGVQGFDPFSFGTGCTDKTKCGNTASTTGPLGLGLAGLAERSITGWLAGATFTSPLARIAAANQVRSAPNVSPVATGLLVGAGGCSSAPAGTGALPVNWGKSLPHSAAGMSMYVVGFTASYIDIRLCGTDTTAGSGTSGDQITIDNNVPSVLGDQWVISLCMQLQAGTLAGIQETMPFISEAGGSGFIQEAQQRYLFPTTDALANQCYQSRYAVESASANKVQPGFQINHFYNSTTPIAVDMTVRIGSPAIDHGTQWSGTIAKENGYSATIAWDASGGPSNFTAPAGSVEYRDLYGAAVATSGGATLSLTGSPVIIENTQWKGWIP